ncbi:MAG TPA: M23 family metallopeptidase [Anaerolineaceae bacterium]|nr:M23 family metallopeptidase [Anaerolineaceae bacterium]
MRSIALFICALALAACQTAAPTTAALAVDLPSSPTRTPLSAQTDEAKTEIAPTATLTTAPLPTEMPFGICSPLAEVSLAELSDILSNPFQLPRPGLDDGHHGIDLAFYSRGEKHTMQGWPVQALLPGQVAGVVLDRPPYGNALIIETRIDALPDGALSALIANSQPTPVPGDIRLTCPTPNAPLVPETDALSIYVLYAHLNTAPLVAAGDQVTCGQAVGEVGTSGASVNPHLHLETRWGPSGAEFTSMAHYEIQATDAERANYCAWRVSGAFQMLDPMQVIAALD